VQLLEPGGVAHVGLFAGHSFDVPRIDQADFNAGVLSTAQAVSQ
jgi:hypothetical protein